MSDLVGTHRTGFLASQLILSECLEKAAASAVLLETPAGHVPISFRNMIIILHYMSHDVRKLVFGSSDQLRHKPACTVTEAG